MRNGDHIRITGRWTIENQHEDECWTRYRGALKVGCVWAELHPVLWDRIELVSPAATWEAVTEMVAVAAPIYEETYQRGGLLAILAGVKGRVFIADDGSNYHSTVIATATISAPTLPQGLTPTSEFIEYKEQIVQTSPEISKSWIQRSSTGITVSVTAAGHRYLTADSVKYASKDDPAFDHNVFRANYTVKWRPRLYANKQGNDRQPIDTLSVPPQPAGSTTPLSIFLDNRGPDPLQTTLTFASNPYSALTVPTAPMTLAARTITEIKASWTLPTVLARNFGAESPPFTVTSVLEIHSNDPARPSFQIEVSGLAQAAALSTVVTPYSTSVDVGRVGIGNHVQRGFFFWNGSGRQIVVRTVNVIQEAPLGQFFMYPWGQSVDPWTWGEVKVWFEPKGLGRCTARGQVEIASTAPIDPQVDTLTFDAFGIGVPRPIGDRFPRVRILRRR